MDFAPLLFKLPLVETEKKLVKPYQEFAEDFHVGFSDQRAKIAVLRRKKKTVFDSPPDHPFVLDLAFEDIAQTKWISLEWKVDEAKLQASSRLTVLISIAASNDAPLTMDLRLNTKDGGTKDVHLGEIRSGQGGDYQAVTVSRPLGDLAAVFDAGVVSAHLMVFFPLESSQKYSVSMFNMFVTESE